MERVVCEAQQLMRSYFEKRGQTNPDDYATRLLDCIHISIDRNHIPDEPVISDKHFGLGVSILHNAHFDVDDLVENDQNITLRIESLHALDAEAGSKVFGCARPLAREITICERALQYEPLYRATMMHELGHIILHGSGGKNLNYSPNSVCRPACEKEADRFMVQTLLPDSVLVLAILFCAHFHRIKFFHSLYTANNEKYGYYQWKRIFLPFIIKTLGVSRQMLAIKLNNLGIFSRKALYYHCPHLDKVSGNLIETNRTQLSKSIQGIIETACKNSDVFVKSQVGSF